MAWLMRSTRFILRQARGATPELEARIDEFAQRVAAALGDDANDEVLVVGHSSGAMLAVSTAARALVRRDRATPAGESGGRPLSLLTLGECIPMLSYQPEAGAFRAELATLATSSSLTWLDFTAPPDGCCFALVDPTAVCEEREQAARWVPPKRLSPRFAQMFDAPTYAQVRADKYRCHFQYLMASQIPGAYDYFAITAGPQRLGDRFAAQAGVENFRDFQMFGGDSGAAAGAASRGRA
jgi:pimeloyl-ACP methyl ester carboxylesterase